jgi:hypothetical protein
VRNGKQPLGELLRELRLEAVGADSFKIIKIIRQLSRCTFKLTIYVYGDTRVVGRLPVKVSEHNDDVSYSEDYSGPYDQEPEPLFLLLISWNRVNSSRVYCSASLAFVDY